MRDINVYGNLHLASGSMSMKGLGAFPENPRSGRLALVGGVLYIYTSIDGIDTWYPLTNRKNIYIHTQSLANLTWTVNHNLGSKDLIFMVYDDGDQIQQVDIEFVSNNSAKLHMSEPMVGRAVFFVATEQFLPAVTSNRMEIGSVVIENDTITVGGLDLIEALNGKLDDRVWIPVANNYNPIDGELILADTRIAPLTFSLPTNPTPGDEIIIADAYSSFVTNNLTLGRNGQKIMGANEDFILDVDNAYVGVVFVSADRGWLITI